MFRVGWSAIVGGSSDLVVTWWVRDNVLGGKGSCTTGAGSAMTRVGNGPVPSLRSAISHYYVTGHTSERARPRAAQIPR
ncbi:hypothetical protein Kpho02_42730 [Kitasatospora phosalacinea]|uniref:Uncharacterized protein n=1 Tax=Kitasatospora phosalacinea TaxID=2065 RepID=A0A9W6V1G5_9ACTN|nr:hypothetical protein Kpho02_42730 [Kitasatospora phosalacinea]